MPSDLRPWPWRTPTRRVSAGRDRESRSGATLRGDSLRANLLPINTLPPDLHATVLHLSERLGSHARTANSSDSAARRKFSPLSHPSRPCRVGEALKASLPSNPRTAGSPPTERSSPPPAPARLAIRRPSQWGGRVNHGSRPR